MTGLDFEKLRRGSPADTATEPRRIFSALPSKDSKYAYPRDVQSEVWERWHERRDESDLVIKMNTGGGKTVVGLILLKSCLNEGLRPAVYVSPDIYLADQVRTEANDLGLETTSDPRSARFRTGKAILVCNVYKLVNGLSQFGVAGSDRQHIDLGTVLIDDVHACLATVQEQFSLRIPRTHPAYEGLLSLFREALETQSRAQLLDIKEGVRSAALRVPWWAWADRQEHVLPLLHKHREEDDFKFVWPLVSEALPICAAAISADAFEIAPPCPPIDRIPSLSGARRRLYLTATLADDSVLVTHFSANPKSISVPVTPKTADDLGDRMILTPLETHPGATDEEIRDFLATQSQRHNVVVIVPSNRRAQFWQPVANAIHDSKTIHEGVAALRNGHVGLVVLINKYDGIDLPGDACRILGLDGVPEAYSALDRIEALSLQDSEAMITRQVQRIEQGMGRGIRSNDDYCVVMLIGSRLTERLHAPRASARFSPATRAQLELSREIAEMLHGSPFREIGAVVDQCLTRDQGWVSASREVLDGITYDSVTHLSAHAVAEREAFDLAMMGRFEDAAQGILGVVTSTTDSRLLGWLKQQAAAYRHFVDPVAAQKLQASAQKDNKALLKPRAGVTYKRLASVVDQSKRAADYLSERYRSSEEMVIGVGALLEDLTPHPDTTERFEQAMQDLAEHLGFAAQRPERDIGEGPDGLWLLGNLKYLVIECKSGVQTDFIARRDAAQLSHSMDWFESQYDDTCRATPVLIHKAETLHKTAVARQGTRVITLDKLRELRAAVRAFVTALAEGSRHSDAAAIAEQLATHRLVGSGFIDLWGKSTRKAKRA